MPGRPAKSLLEHIEDGSFEARNRKHRALLEEGLLVPYKDLRRIQQRFRRTLDEGKQYDRALDFERAVRERRLASGYVDDDDDAGPPLEEILDELGPPHSAERVINFFELLLRHFKGVKAGMAFLLDKWQKAFLREAFKRKRGRRIYKLIYLIVPGGNGKSPLAAGLGLHAICEFNDAPDVLCLAGIKDQADIVQEFARGFVEGPDDETPGELSRFLRVRGRRIVRKATRALMRVLASSGANLEGTFPKVVVVDELHAFKDKRQEHSFVALISKLIKDPESYAIIISTAGRGADNFLGRKLKEHFASKTMKVARRGSLTIGRDEAEGVLIWMYAAPKEAPLTGKAGLEAIRKANPASWLDPQDVMKMKTHVGEAEFRRLARNEFIAERNQWLPMGALEKCRHKTRLWTPRRPQRGWPADGAKVVLGFDGSYDNDSTGLVGWDMAAKHLFTVAVWERPEGDPEWVVPRGAVKAAVDEAMERWNVLRLAADPPGWYDEIEEWSLKYAGVFVTMFPTNQIKLMGEACREFYGDVVYKKLTTDGHPALERHFSNAYTREGADGAYIVKERRDSPNKIDLAVGGVMARYLGVREKPKKKAKLVSW